MKKSNRGLRRRGSDEKIAARVIYAGAAFHRGAAPRAPARPGYLGWRGAIPRDNNSSSTSTARKANTESLRTGTGTMPQRSQQLRAHRGDPGAASRPYTREVPGGQQRETPPLPAGISRPQNPSGAGRGARRPAGTLAL